MLRFLQGRYDGVLRVSDQARPTIVRGLNLQYFTLTPTREEDEERYRINMSIPKIERGLDHCCYILTFSGCPHPAAANETSEMANPNVIKAPAYPTPTAGMDAPLLSANCLVLTPLICVERSTSRCPCQ